MLWLEVLPSNWSGQRPLSGERGALGIDHRAVLCSKLNHTCQTPRHAEVPWSKKMARKKQLEELSARPEPRLFLFFRRATDLQFVRMVPRFANQRLSFVKHLLAPQKLCSLLHLRCGNSVLALCLSFSLACSDISLINFDLLWSCSRKSCWNMEQILTADLHD